jgi:hypothetical protein
MSRQVLLAVIALLLAVPATSSAVELAEGKLTVGGNGAWAFLKTDHNGYLDADPDGEWTTAMFDLLAIAKPTEDIQLATQVGFEPVDTDEAMAAELEWAFAEWRASDYARFRAGKVKQPFGNYAEVQFVGVTRPFYDLATSVYGPADVTASAYSGVGVTGEWYAESGFGLQWDAYGGAVDLKDIEPWETTGDPLAVPQVEDQIVENLVGGRLSLSTPWNVTLRLSGFGGKVEKEMEEKNVFAVYGVSLQHRSEKLWVSVEAFQAVEKGDEKQISAYGELAYFLTKSLQLAARYELARADIEEIDVPARLRNHDEVALGVNWWFSPQVVAKVSAHQTWGYRFITPEPGMNPSSGTFTLVAGTQFTF